MDYVQNQTKKLLSDFSTDQACQMYNFFSSLINRKLLVNNLGLLIKECENKKIF
jgi:hypothetical protein